MDGVWRAIRRLSRMWRGLALRLFIRLGGGSCGHGLQIEKGTHLRWWAHPGIQIGQNVRLGRGVVIDAPRGSLVLIGDDVKIMHYSVVAASLSVTIGAGTQIGEMCSIRDSDHDGGGPESAVDANDRCAPVVIGERVWIGRGVAVIRGSRIGSFAKVGANSVVTRSRSIPNGASVAGAPAASIKNLK